MQIAPLHKLANVIIFFRYYDSPQVCEHMQIGVLSNNIFYTAYMSIMCICITQVSSIQV